MSAEDRTPTEPHETPEAPPHDGEHAEPLGPFTPDDRSPAGDTPEVHDDLTPHDLRPGTDARKAAEERVGEDGVTRGNR